MYKNAMYKTQKAFNVLGTCLSCGFVEGFSYKKKAATYSPTLRCSTIGVLGLNFSVRDGKRWNPKAIAT